MVITAKRCDISAIPDAIVVSLPYAAGITIVLSPIGIARDEIAQIAKVFESGTSMIKPINNNG